MESIVPLWIHQERGVELAWNRFTEQHKGDFAYFMQMGTGKTLTTITLLRKIFTTYKRPLRTLILCPQIVVKNWKSEIERFSHMGNLVCTLEGTGEKRKVALDRGIREGKSLFITNLENLSVVEGLLWETKKRGKDEIRVPINHGWEAVVFDEIHRLKNPSAKSFKMAYKIADKCFFKYGLTGTPIANNELDIWALFRVLDGGELLGKSYQAFKQKWFVDENASMPAQKHFPSWRIKPGSAEELAQLIYTKAMRVTKEECLDLPPLIQKRVEVEMSPKQARAYGEMKRDFIAYLESGTAVATLAITKGLRLQQIASGFVKLEDDSIVTFPDSPRLVALAELLEDIPGKVIIWACFKENYAAIAKVCEKLGRSYAFITGEQSQKEKNAAEHDFTKGAVETLICNPAAGGTGVNLIEAPTAIWFSRSFKLTDRLQAIARNHRGGSEIHEKITMIDLVSPGTIDEHVLDALDRKESIAEAILSWRNKV